jgi:REP element-mobilizing transposase RayT
MSYDPDLHHRRSNRLVGYDYSQTGAYFITICTNNRECLFGDIGMGQMTLNAVGQIVADEWMKTVAMRSSIESDEWVVMPNHFHALVVVNNDTAMLSPEQSTEYQYTGSETFGCPVRGSIPTIVRSFKSAVTKRVNLLRQTPGLPLWQRNYWDHVIRDEVDFNRIREYIQINPQRWELDSLHQDSN